MEIVLSSYGPWDSRPSGSSGPKDFDKMVLEFGKKHMRSLLGGGKGRNFKNKSVFSIVLLLALVLWLLTGIYTVQPDEEGVELRFGKYSMTTMPGLHYHLPYPIEEVFQVKVTNVNHEEIGYRSALGNRNYKSNFNDESLMLTGDENIVDVNFEVQWRIANAAKYLFNLRDAAKGYTVKSAAESAMREVIGSSKIAFALEGDGRAYLATKAKEILQHILDEYDMGVEVLPLQMKKVDPPDKVIDAFRDVQSARADKERVINDSYAYSNDIIPRARGEGDKILQEAEAYAQEAINGAEGEASRFLSVYSEYSKSKEITKERMYLDMMGSVLGGTKKIITDRSSMLAHLPLTEMFRFNYENK